MSEPMTLVTDYVLCVASAVFAFKLWMRFRPWALAFLFTAAGSLLGGTYHGFGPELTSLWAAALWKATVIAIGVASFFLLTGAARGFVLIATIKFVVYASWMITHDHFIWVVADYGLTLILIAIAQFAAWRHARASSAPWFFGSFAVSLIGAAVEGAHVDLHPHFNHNDLYHVIQLIALWMLYRAGLRMPETAPPTSQPT